MRNALCLGAVSALLAATAVRVGLGKSLPLRPGDGGPATKAMIDGPQHLVFDPVGNLFVYESSDDRPPAIREIAAGTQTITTVLIGCNDNAWPPPQEGDCLGHLSDMRVDRNGRLLVVEHTKNRLRWLDVRSKIPSLVVGIGERLSVVGVGPLCAVMDRLGNIFVCDFHRIRKIDSQTGVISTIAGTDKPGSGGDHGPASGAQLYFPNSIAVDQDGDLFIADQTARIRRIDATTGIIETIAGTARPDRLNPSQGSLANCFAFDAEGKPAVEADLCSPSQLAFDRQNNLLFLDSEGPVNPEMRICKIDHGSGRISVIAGVGKTGYSGDGGPATRAQIDVSDMALDANGNLFFADWQHNRIRRVDAATGIIATFAGNGMPKRAPPGGPI